MQAFKQHIIFRFFCLVLAIHILNCSVDAPDVRPENIPEDLSYNDMESVMEIVLENVFEIKDAIAEQDDHDSNGDNNLNFKKQVFFCYCATLETKKIQTNEIQIIVQTNYDEQFSSQFHPEIVPPPPKA